MIITVNKDRIIKNISAIFNEAVNPQKTYRYNNLNTKTFILDDSFILDYSFPRQDWSRKYFFNDSY
jgi:hypothetical protein